jgi:hypothetical protein
MRLSRIAAWFTVLAPLGLLVACNSTAGEGDSCAVGWFTGSTECEPGYICMDTSWTCERAPYMPPPYPSSYARDAAAPHRPWLVDASPEAPERVDGAVDGGRDAVVAERDGGP